MNKQAFFEALRKQDSGLFGTSLSQRQVEGTEALVDALSGFSLPHAAHVLAESYHETGGGMYPVKETVFPHSKNKNPSDATVIARLDRAFAKGQLTWVRTPYWRGGMFGRGQIQITHEDNYRKASALVGVDLVSNPGRALELPISAKIAAEGCRSGMFTGLKLADFDGPDGYDHHNARAIVNGDKHVMGATMVKYGRAFEKALREAGWGRMKPSAPLPPRETPQSQPRGSLWALLARFFSALSRK
ncbi:hypothetical protein DVVG_00014 [Dunaliella viridis virus SI2]|uniref:hypothetical protein n=1 Tax=Dunaliella viridis virus SI2 TaxID=754069 RepID=UPI0002C06D71|nr:hypothetical protein DVVG_00014 [Dunaliella viridis virus SI2]AGH16000.1 hypothetical protein DVVG_00014 [Dunaliella viridis virus SI2]